MVHCVGLTLTAVPLPVLVITLPVFPTAASKAGVPPADTPPGGDSRKANVNTSAVSIKYFSLTSFKWGEIFQFSNDQSWLGHVVLVQWHQPAVTVFMHTGE